MKPPARKVHKAGGTAESPLDPAAPVAKAAPAAAGRAPRTAARGPAKAAQDAASEAPAANRARGSSVNSSRRKRRPSALSTAEDDADAAAADSPATCTNANHNKYCHFCQHVKVRASSMLACENMECCRRFCEHCLLTHLGENVDPMSSDAWTLVDGKPFWNCPICRKKCCCSVAQCNENHRHCKAYRYRRRRAELATKRQSAAASHAQAEKRGKKASPTRAPLSAKLSHTTPTLARPTLSFGFVRSSVAAQLDSPPMMRAGGAPSVPSFGDGAPAGARPRREAALKRRHYDLDGATDDEGDPSDGDEEGSDEITTPGIEGASPVLVHQAPPGEPHVHHHHITSHHMLLAPPPPPGDAHHAGAEAAAPSAPSTAPSAGLWSAEEGPGHHHAMAHEMQGYRSDEESDNLMLGGIYGHMGDHAAPSPMISAADMGCAEMLIDDVNIGSAELEEARWLRRTYETVYNPAARQRALQALSGDGAKPAHHAAAPPPPARPAAAAAAPGAGVSMPPTGPSSNDEGGWKGGEGAVAPAWGPPKAHWGEAGKGAGGGEAKCHVMYEMV